MAPLVAPPAVPISAPLAAPRAHSRSPPPRPVQPVARLTSEDRGIKVTDVVVKERKRAVYRREAGPDPAQWPLPGHSVNESEQAHARDAVPYLDVAGGRWAGGLWLGHVHDILETPLWLAHKQTWSLREELYLQWAEQQREALVLAGAVPQGALLTARERRLQEQQRRLADLSGLTLARHLSTFLAE